MRALKLGEQPARSVMFFGSSPKTSTALFCGNFSCLIGSKSPPLLRWVLNGIVQILRLFPSYFLELRMKRFAPLILVAATGLATSAVANPTNPLTLLAQSSVTPWSTGLGNTGGISSLSSPLGLGALNPLNPINSINPLSPWNSFGGASNPALSLGALGALGALTSGLSPNALPGSGFGQMNNPFVSGQLSNNSFANNSFANNPFANNPFGGNSFGGNPLGGNAFAANPFAANPFGGNPYLRQAQPQPFGLPNFSPSMPSYPNLPFAAQQQQNVMPGGYFPGFNPTQQQMRPPMAQPQQTFPFLPYGAQVQQQQQQQQQLWQQQRPQQPQQPNLGNFFGVQPAPMQQPQAAYPLYPNFFAAQQPVQQQPVPQQLLPQQLQPPAYNFFGLTPPIPPAQPTQLPQQPTRNITQPPAQQAAPQPVAPQPVAQPALQPSIPTGQLPSGFPFSLFAPQQAAPAATPEAKPASEPANAPTNTPASAPASASASAPVSKPASAPAAIATTGAKTPAAEPAKPVQAPLDPAAFMQMYMNPVNTNR
jgi:hypothetical protein